MITGDWRDLENSTLKKLMLVKFVTYRSCLEGLYLAAFRMPPTLAERYEKRRRIIQTLLWFGSSLIIAAYVKDIQYAIALIGGLAALFIFFYPGICLVQEMVQYPVLTLKRKLLILLGLWYVVIGVFLFADSEVFAIMQDIKAKSLYWLLREINCKSRVSVSYNIETLMSVYQSITNWQMQRLDRLLWYAMEQTQIKLFQIFFLKRKLWIYCETQKTVSTETHLWDVIVLRKTSQSDTGILNCTQYHL